MGCVRRMRSTCIARTSLSRKASRRILSSASAAAGNNVNARLRSRRRSSDLGARQKGVIVVLVTIAMLVMLGIVGLALDGAHGMLNKSRLQNTVDSAALSAAKTLDQTKGDTVAALAEALSMFGT